MQLWRVWVLGAVLLLSRGARATPEDTRSTSADVAKQAQELLDQGIAFFKADDLERARVALSRVVVLVPEKPNPYRWLGLVESRLGHCKDAVVAFDAFLSRTQPGDGRVVEVVTLRDRCNAELAPKLGTLVVASTPAGAEVYLRAAGDPLLGTTPLTSDKMSAGSHVLAVRKPGYFELLREVDVRQNEVVRLDLVLALVPPPPPPRKRRYWIAGAVLGPLAAIGLGVGLGVGLTRGGERTLPAVSAP